MRVALELLPAVDAGQSRQRHVKAWRLSSSSSLAPREREGGGGAGGAETGGGAGAETSARRAEAGFAASEGRRRAEERGPVAPRLEEGGSGRQCAAASPMPAVQDMSQILQERHLLSGLFALAGSHARRRARLMHAQGVVHTCRAMHARARTHTHACTCARTQREFMLTGNRYQTRTHAHK